MTDITADDEREARRWANNVMENRDRYNVDDAVAARTLLALLDRPRMPDWHIVSHDEVLLRQMRENWRCAPDGHDKPRHALRAFYDFYGAPPKPAKVEAWAVVDESGTHHATYDYCAAAEAYLKGHGGSIKARIVRLVEADSHDQ